MLMKCEYISFKNRMTAVFKYKKILFFIPDLNRYIYAESLQQCRAKFTRHKVIPAGLLTSIRVLLFGITPIVKDITPDNLHGRDIMVYTQQTARNSRYNLLIALNKYGVKTSRRYTAGSNISLWYNRAMILNTMKSITGIKYTKIYYNFK